MRLVFTTSGLAVSYAHNLESGPTIIVIAAAAYLLATVALRVGKTFTSRRAG